MSNQEQSEAKPQQSAPADSEANELLTARQKLEKFLNEKNAVTDILNQIEEQTGVQKIYQVGGMFVLSSQTRYSNFCLL